MAAGVSETYFAVARYNQDGALDSTFGVGGKVITDVSDGNTVVLSPGAFALAIQPDGKLVAAGDRRGFSYDFALVRYNTDGTLDGTFGVGGQVNTTFVAESDEHARALAIQADGKLVVAGFTNIGHFNFALARYRPDGVLHRTFGDAARAGLVMTDFLGGDYAYALAIQADGKIVAAGETTNGGDFALARYEP